MKAAPDFPTDSCERNCASRVFSMMTARTPWRFLVHVNWAGVSDGRAQSDWICSDFKPARLVVFYPLAIPLLIGDQVIGIFEPAFLELDISDNHLILIDAAFENAVGPRDFHHFEAEIAQFMGGEKGAVGPTERHP